MQCLGFTVNLKDDPDLIERYKEYHRHVWPEVLEFNRRRGVTDVRLFLLGRRLFMYFEAPDDLDLSKNLGPAPGSNPRVEEWNEMMRAFFEPVPESQPGELWTRMEIVFGG